MSNIYYICHRLVLVYADTKGEFKFTRKFGENLTELQSDSSYVWKGTLIQNSLIRCEKTKKNIVRSLKKAWQSRWVSFHASVNDVFQVRESLGKYLEETRDIKKASDSLWAGLLKKIKQESVNFSVCFSS